MVTTITDRLYGESSGVAVKAPVVAVATAALSLSGLTPVGSYAPSEGDRILVAAQADPTANGIYNASASAWQRAGDFDGAYDCVQGTLVVAFLQNGQSLTYQLVTQNPVIGTTQLNFLPYWSPQQPIPQSPIEASANVVPVNFTYPVGHAFRYGATGSGSKDDTAALEQGLQVAAASIAGSGAGVATGSARLYLPTGNYLTSSTLNRPAGTYIVGDGPEATTITASGNYSIIATTGSQTNVPNRGGVQNLCLVGTWGANNANTNSVGISESWVNRSIHRDVRIHGCYQGIYGIALWQVIWDNISVDGGGTEQNSIGFYLDQLPTTFPSGTSNAVIATGCVAYVSGIGYQLLNPNGSKFTSCEAAEGQYGWLIGGTSAGCYTCEFGNFVNCLADTCSVYGWAITQGSNANPCNYMQFANCWSSTCQNGWYLSGCVQINISNGQTGNCTAGGIYLLNCQKCLVSAHELQNNNTAATAGIGDITISGGSYNRITCCISQGFGGGASSFSLLETGGSASNVIVLNSLFAGASISSGSTVISQNQGFRTETVGQATVGAASTSAVVPHNLAMTPNLDAIIVTPSTGWGSATQYWVSNPTSTTFTINVNIAPGGSGMGFGYQINLNRVY